jgi:hypothetical protein
VVTDVLGSILSRHIVEDVSVEDPPLEEAIADMFATVDEPAATSNRPGSE